MEQILFVKYSNERAEEFSIRTELWEDESGNRKIVKAPISSYALKHVQNMDEAYTKLLERYSNGIININKCTYSEGRAEFEYLDGITLQEKLDEYIDTCEWNKLYELLDFIVEIIAFRADNEFEYTEEFKHIFGNSIEEIKCSKCADVTDIDMILSNIIINEQVNLIDYEWTFTFPIPYKFVVYRLCYFLMHQCHVNDEISFMSLMNRYEIDEKQCQVYAEMERNFQDYIHGNVKTLREFGTEKIEHIRSINDINEVYIRNPQGLFVTIYGYNRDSKEDIFVTRKNIILNRRFAEEVHSIYKKLRIVVNCGCGLLIVNGDIIDIDSINGMKIAENIYLYIADKMEFTLPNEHGKRNIDFSIVKLEVQSALNIKKTIDNFVIDNQRLKDEMELIRNEK